jgi:hypothetical protein
MNRMSQYTIGTLLTAVLASCSPPRPTDPPRTLASHPRAFDRYARLLQRELVDTNPVATGQLIACEINRLGFVFGSDEVRRRMYPVEDSVWATPALRARADSIDVKLGGHSYEGVGPLCDSLNAIANREDPIAPLDTSGWHR